MCVCVRERERERDEGCIEGERKKEKGVTFINNTISIINHTLPSTIRE